MKLLFSKLIFVLMLFGVKSCDFTSAVNRDILAAQHYVDNQEFAKAVELYEKILKQNPSKLIKTKIYYQIAEINYLYLDEQVKALSYYQYIIDNVDDPLWQVKSLEKIADINFSFSRNYQHAKKAYEVLLEVKPRLKNFDFYAFRVAECFFEMGDYENARKHFARFLDQPNNSFHVEAYNQK